MIPLSPPQLELVIEALDDGYQYLIDCLDNGTGSYSDEEYSDIETRSQDYAKLEQHLRDQLNREDDE